MKVKVFRTSDYKNVKEMEFNTLEELYKYAQDLEKELYPIYVGGVIQPLIITTLHEPIKDENGKQTGWKDYPAIEIYDDYREYNDYD